MSSLFGLNEFNHLVHVREVERGLACQCRCVVCEEPLVARQGSVREHHFAHASNREPCDSSHESLLHRYAKQVIVQARGLVAPMTPAVAHFLGISDTSSPDLLHALSSVQEEVMIGTIKPDLLVVTPGGIQVAVEIAYSSFCDLIKVAAFESLNLPALEIDLGIHLKSGIRDNRTRGKVAEFLKEKATSGSRLSVVSAYFTIYAYEALSDQLDGIESLQFLFGEPKFIQTLDPEKTDKKAFKIEDEGLELANRLQQKEVARRCAEWITNKVEIRSIREANLLHGKLYHVDDGRREHALMGSSNFTQRGLGCLPRRISS
jgi:phosphatidylserine/phosphatidylglycerophosphate/cardiolipin synthase-like enzyme